MISAPFDGTVIDILLIEDNRGDARLAQEALRDGKFRIGFHHVWDGEEAMDFLRRTGKHAGAPRPDLVLLDLNLPRLDGREVLAEIKADASLRSIPVVVLTTSSAEQDVFHSYDLHANCYITKPVTMVDFLKVVSSIQDFWLTIVKLPVAPPA
ncbi:MAG: response regulator [Bryobacteraceae bacterium]|jgi:CheY-like chemotaxis protein